jgi:hypothetical protein
VAVILVRGAIGFISVLTLELICLPGWWYRIGVGVLIGVILGVIGLLRRREILSYSWWNPLGRSGGQTPATERLVCIGDPIELDQFVGINGELREPSIFRALPISFAALQSGLLVIVATVWVATRTLIGPDQLPRILISLVALSTCVLLVHLSRGYYRVVPQRLDKLDFRRLGSIERTCQSWDLKNACITCDLARRCLEIKPSAAGAGQGVEVRQAVTDRSPVRLSLRRFDHPHAFAIAVFQAAVCKRASPPLQCNQVAG